VTEGRIAFWYRPIPTAVALLTFLVAGVVLMGILFWPRASGSRFAGVVLFLTGAWALFYVMRRLSNPWRVEIEDQELEAASWRGRRKWSLAELSIRPSSFGSAWEGSAVVAELDGRVAFRVFRDLVGYARFCEIIKYGAA
jgi:uncharacterized membrane protein